MLGVFSIQGCSDARRRLEAHQAVVQELVTELLEKLSNGSAPWLQFIYSMVCLVQLHPTALVKAC
jgi:hypothetical protein